jgi:hypothetical protein
VRSDVSRLVARPHSVFARRDLRPGPPFFVAIVCGIAVIAAALPEAIAGIATRLAIDAIKWA